MNWLLDVPVFLSVRPPPSVTHTCFHLQHYGAFLHSWSVEKKWIPAASCDLNSQLFLENPWKGHAHWAGAKQLVASLPCTRLKLYSVEEDTTPKSCDSFRRTITRTLFIEQLLYARRYRSFYDAFAPFVDTITNSQGWQTDISSTLTDDWTETYQS
jgi:hypothetical protein